MVHGRLAVRAALGTKLRVEGREEVGCRADGTSPAGHAFGDFSPDEIRAATRSRTRAKKAGGTCERSFTTLPAKIWSCSAGDIRSNSAAVMTLHSTFPILPTPCDTAALLPAPMVRVDRSSRDARDASLCRTPGACW